MLSLTFWRMAGTMCWMCSGGARSTRCIAWVAYMAYHARTTVALRCPTLIRLVHVTQPCYPPCTRPVFHPGSTAAPAHAPRTAPGSPHAMQLRSPAPSATLAQPSPRLFALLGSAAAANESNGSALHPAPTLLAPHLHISGTSASSSSSTGSNSASTAWPARACRPHVLKRLQRHRVARPAYRVRLRNPAAPASRYLCRTRP